MTDASEIRSYSYPPGYRKVHQRQALLRIAAILGSMAVAFVVGRAIWRLFEPDALELRFDAITLYIDAGAAALFFFSVWRRVRKASAVVESYQLTLGPNVLRITALGMLPTEVLRADVERIEELRGGLCVRFAGRMIGVPRAVTDYDEVRRRLADWSPIVPRRNERLQAVALGGLVMAWMLAIIVDGAPGLLRIVLGLAVLACYGWVMRVYLRTRLDAKSKARIVAGVGLFAAGIAVRVVVDFLQWMKLS